MLTTNSPPDGRGGEGGISVISSWRQQAPARRKNNTKKNHRTHTHTPRTNQDGMAYTCTHSENVLANPNAYSDYGLTSQQQNEIQCPARPRTRVNRHDVGSAVHKHGKETTYVHAGMAPPCTLRASEHYSSNPLAPNPSCLSQTLSLHLTLRASEQTITAATPLHHNPSLSQTLSLSLTKDLRIEKKITAAIPLHQNRSCMSQTLSLPLPLTLRAYTDQPTCWKSLCLQTYGPTKIPVAPPSEGCKLYTNTVLRTGYPVAWYLPYTVGHTSYHIPPTDIQRSIDCSSSTKSVQ